MTVKQKDIAEAAGVSISTVSRVLNGICIKTNSYKYLNILRIAEELGYKKDISELKSDIKDLKKIGLILPRVGDSFFSKILKIISEAFSKNYNYQVIFYCTNDNQELEDKALNVLINQDIQGLIIAPCSKKIDSLKEIRRKKVPLIILDRFIEGIDADFIFVDNEYGVYQSVKYLIDNGHRKIGFVQTSKTVYTNIERLRGYRRALQESDIPFDESLIILKDNRESRGYIETKFLLNLENPPTAIFSPCDTVTLGVLEAIYEEKLRIPEDISLIAFDDFSLAPYLDSPLTVVSQPIEDIGNMTVKVMVERINNPTSRMKKIELKTKFIIRNSVRNLRNDLYSNTDNVY